jgi:hypothetical protein
MEEAVLQYQVETPAEKLFKMSVIGLHVSHFRVIVFGEEIKI